MMDKQVNGIFLLNKPLGLSSNTALQKVKHIFNAKKAGHTGSLDPLATGMLPICLGQATKYSQFLLDAVKSYRVKGELGKQTTTGDAEGEVVNTASGFTVSLKELQAVINQFIGPIKQTVSAYSALKYQGKPLYYYARAGIEVPLKSREVTIESIQLIEFDGQSFVIDVVASKGTYMRNLVEDIGFKLGVYAYVSQLHRLYSQPFIEEPMYQLETLVTAAKEGRDIGKWLLPIDASLTSLPVLELNETSGMNLIQGKAIEIVKSPGSGLYRLYDNSQYFYGVVRVENSRITALRMLSQPV